MQKDLSVIRKIADAAVCASETDGLCRRGGLLRRISADYRSIMHFSRKISDTPSKEALTGFEIWLAENCYIIENEYDNCKAMLKGLPPLPGSEGIPRICLIVQWFVHHSDTELCRDCVSEIFDAMERHCNLTLDEYFCAHMLFRSALISSCAGIIASYDKKRSGGAVLKEEIYAEQLGRLINSLRYISHHNFHSNILSGKVCGILNGDPSGAFRHMTDSTKIFYLDRFRKLAKKAHTDEQQFALDIVEKAEQAVSPKEKHVGYYLYIRKKFPQILYFSILFGASIGLTLGLSVVSPLCLLLFIPIFEAVKLMTDSVFSHLFCSLPLPRMEISDIPDNAGVLVVITTLLLGEDSDSELFDRLERIYLSNGGKNIFFGVLADIADSKSAKAPGDEEVLNHAYGRINALTHKYGEHFILFERRRSYSKSEEVFMGWERKRGAVTELVRFLKGHPTTFSTHCISGATGVLKDKNIKYVITLDSDTNLSIDSVKEMCSIMLHPLITPVIDRKKGIVTDGHGILQPRCTPQLSAAGATPFSRMMCGEGGSDIYSYAAFDLYQSIFGEGIFCGKGIFNIDAFDAVINQSNTFPEDRILSHDCLEGAKLRSGLISDMVLTDGFPKHELSYSKRRHRWIRGDIQNLIFLFPYIKVNGEKKKNNISLLSKFKLLDNIRSAFVPVFSFVCIWASIFCNAPVRNLLIFFGLAHIAVPFVTDTISLIFSPAFKSVARRFFSKGVSASIHRSFLRALFNFGYLPKLALSSADAITRSLYRLFISRKKLLEWQTAAHSETEDGSLICFVHKDILCAFSGFLLFAFAPAGFLRALAVLWFAFPVIAYHTSFDRKKRRTENSSEIQRLRDYALDIWRFFKNNVTERDNFLPPDNIQLAPQSAVAHRTSPTNIGLYLVSVLCARDFGFIGTPEMYRMLCDSISSVEKMTKWHGHLYNWYDTENLAVLSPFYISTVDSGNLTACLITLRQGLREYVHEEPSLIELIKRIEELENSTDYSILYNRERELFSLGADIDKNGTFKLNSGCYDLIMSEARTASYIECAKRHIPKKHWSSLSRTFITEGGYIGLSSWTGTAFEYFMPSLFLPLCKRSLCSEALLYAFKAQTHRYALVGGKNLWGISESGYFSFDSEMNYKYRAFGIPKLALKSGLEKELVISPYSSFLALCINREKSLRNLENIKELGFYGKYGFYEAIDFTPSRCPEGGATVKSYMAHHMGMSLAALCNCVFENVLVKRFMSDCAMSSAVELLEERIPVDAMIRRIRKSRYIPTSQSRYGVYEGKIYNTPSLSVPDVSVISDGFSKCIVTSSGHIEMFSGDILINTCDYDLYECTTSLFGFADDDGKAVSPSLLPGINSRNAEYSMKSSGGCIELASAVSGKYNVSQKITMLRRENTIFSLQLSVVPKKHEKISHEKELVFCFTPIIAPKRQYEAHRSFSELFIESEFAGTDKILLYKRRPSVPGNKAVYLAVALADKDADIEFDTRAGDVFSNLFSPSDYSGIIKKSCSNNIGACIRPCCRIKTKAKKRGDSYGCELLLCCADSIDGAISSVKNARQVSFAQKCSMLTEIYDRFCAAAGTGLYGTRDVPSGSERLLPGIIFGKGATVCEKGKYIGIGELWKHGISGDIPIVALTVVSSALIPKVEKYLRAAKLMRYMKVRFDLCIIYTETEKYRRPVYNEISELISNCELSEYVKRGPGGIFLVDKSADPAFAEAIITRASFSTDILSENYTNRERLSHDRFLLPVCDPVLAADLPVLYKKTLSLNHGDFDTNGFTCSKEKSFDAPYSFVLTGRRISCLLTQNSLGYTWVQNAKMCRITPFRDDPFADMKGEKLILFSGNGNYDLCAMSKHVSFGIGKALYRGYANGIEYSVTVYLSEKLCVKYCDVKLKFPMGSNETVKLIFMTSPIMGCDDRESGHIQLFHNSELLMFKNPFAENFGAFSGFIGAVRSDSAKLSNAQYITDKSNIYCSNASGNKSIRNDCAAVSLSVSPYDNCEYYRFFLGAYNDNGKVLEFNLGQITNGECELKHASAFSESLIPPVSIVPKLSLPLIQSHAEMFNKFLPYQNAAARFFARSGFYQSGGAYGFRDQLQDCLCLMYSLPKATLSHIYRCCSRQFPEGDVLHWWHEKSEKGTNGPGCRGVRTLCSDNYLWLPYTVSEYYSFSQNKEFLLKNVPFADAAPLPEDKREMYTDIHKSKKYDTVYGHCKRALDRACERLGVHGLPLIGSCDWCDGYSHIGTPTEGESVWLAMFLCIVIEKFCNICRKMADTEALDKYTHVRLNMLAAIEKHGYNEQEGQYYRAYFPNGNILGSRSSDECRTDLLPQCFAPLHSKLPDTRVYTVLKNAFNTLFDSEYKIFRLLAPAFVNTANDPGYIKGYVAGTRENGGQYTHAAVWGVIGLIHGARALFLNNDRKESAELSAMATEAFLALNPILRSWGYLGEDAKKAYLLEPYFTCGDIYANKDHYGRGGWSVYTGSAAWYYKLMLEYVFGIRLFGLDGDTVSMEAVSDFPMIAGSLLCGLELMIRYKNGSCHITFIQGKHNRLRFDGEESVGRICLCEGEHFLEITRPAIDDDALM